MKRAIINLLTAGGSLLLVLVVLEIGARVYLWKFADEGSFRRYASINQLNARDAATTHPSNRYTAHRYIGYIPTPSYRYGNNRHNALGFRGEEIVLPKPEGEFRIVCLGGSTTYTLVASHVNSYPAQMESALREMGYSNVSVVNAGAEGWSSYESFINFQLRVLDLAPDLIVLYEGINDNLARMIWPPEAYRGDNSGYRGPNVTGLRMPNILEYSTFCRMAGIRMGWIYPHSSLSRTLIPLGPASIDYLWAQQVAGGTYPSGIFEEHPIEVILRNNPPVYFRRNVLNIVDTAKRHGIRIVFATFAYCPEFGDPFVSDSRFTWTYDETNAIYKDIAASEGGIAVFDFAAAFPRDKKYWGDGLHVNTEGAELMGRQFAEFLAGSALLPEPSGPKKDS